MSGNTSFGYPRELYHPNGFKTCVVYSPDEHKAANAEFDAWRMEHQANTAAAERGDDAPTGDAIPKRRGRPRKDAPAEQTEIVGDE